MSNTDGIRQLDLALVSKSCCYDILCNVTCCVCCGTVYLGAVLTGECAATVTCVSTVGVYDDLTSGQAAVSVRAADYETSGRVNDCLLYLVYHISRDDLVKYILLNILMDLLLGYILIMLGRKNNCIQTYWLVILIIFYSNLGLSIWTKVL